MERIGRKIGSFAAAEEAEDEYYRSLAPDDRVELLLKLVEQHKGAFKGSAEFKKCEPFSSRN